MATGRRQVQVWISSRREVKRLAPASAVFRPSGLFLQADITDLILISLTASTWWRCEWTYRAGGGRIARRRWEKVPSLHFGSASHALRTGKKINFKSRHDFGGGGWLRVVENIRGFNASLIPFLKLWFDLILSGRYLWSKYAGCQYEAKLKPIYIFRIWNHQLKTNPTSNFCVHKISN